jgi:hypothetical protein
VNDPLSTTLELVQKDLSINTISVYAAAQEAVKGFEKLPKDVKKTFIFTGNKGNTVVSGLKIKSSSRSQVALEILTII